MSDVIHYNIPQATYSRCHDNITVFNLSPLNLTHHQTIWRLVLRQEREELFLRIPAFVILSFLMVVGVLGNILVLVVYKRSFGPSTTRVFLTAMAAFDLLNCSVGIPFELAGIADDISQNTPRVCKTSMFFMIAAASGSISVLVFVSIDRFRRVCHPWKTQMTPRQAKWLVLVVCTIAVVVSTPNLIFYGVKTDHRYGLRVYDCLIDDSWAESMVVFVYQLLQFFISFFCIIVLIVIYICITCKIRKQQVKRKTLAESPLSSQSLHSADRRVYQDPYTQNYGKARTCNRPRGSGGVNVGSEGSDSIISADNNLTASEVSPHGSYQLFTCIDQDCAQNQSSTSRPDKNAQCFLHENGTAGGSQENPTHQPRAEAENPVVISQSREMNPCASSDGKSLLPRGSKVSFIAVQYIHNEQETAGEIDSAVDSMNSPKASISSDVEMTEMEAKVKTVVDVSQKSLKPTDRKLSTSKTDDITPSKLMTKLAKKNSTASDGKCGREVRASKLTVMMLAISVAFILSYLPVLGLSIFRGIYPETIRHLLCSSRVYYACHHVILRSYFINNAINPIIYSVFNKTFRRKSEELVLFAVTKLLFFKPDK